MFASQQNFSRYARLALASFLALYFELVIIRYLSSEIRVFAYLKNLPLVASFFGLGVGMVLGSREKLLTRLFPLSAAALFLLMHFAPALNLTHLPFPSYDYLIWSEGTQPASSLAALFRYVGVITFVSALIVVFCIPLGSRIGRALDGLPPLKGYAVDLAGSLAGIGAFTLLAFLWTPPWAWLLVGVAVCIALLHPWFADASSVVGARWERAVAVALYAALPLIIALVPVFLPARGGEMFWSPYYRISLRDGEKLTDTKNPLDASLDKLFDATQSKPPVTYLTVNYDYHQKILNLSDTFFANHPGAEPNKSALLTYDFPYLVHPGAKNVLVLGSGTGNDVAAALRHGAERVDAVEIDPVILELGREKHPERPYDSPRVRVFVNDARAYIAQAKSAYDLVVFAYLDSHTLLANSSSLRLDNYVYTKESLQEARELLSPGGTLVLAFAAGKSFVNARMYRMLTDVFGEPPAAYHTNYDGGGVVFVSGPQLKHPALSGIPIINRELEALGTGLAPATDRWPFLYLRSRSIPTSYSIVFLLLALGWVFGKRMLAVERVWTRSNLHFFALGAAFLLLETKAVTELSLVFGSTWVVNTVAIASFLGMAIIANAVTMRYAVSRNILYALLFVSVVLSIVFPLGVLSGLPMVARILAAGSVLALPVFFSGMLFSRAFSETLHPGQSLGVNILGALVGGVAENTVMIGGTLLLGILAMVFYAVSLVAATESSLFQHLLSRILPRRG